MRKKPELLHAETIAKTRIFHVEQLDLRFSNGVEVRYERLCTSSNGAVLIVPMLDNDTVLLIREYAAGVGRYELALPKGRVEKGETLEQAANRELMEEVGYAANTLAHISSMTIAPGYLAHTTHVVLAQDLYPCRLPGDEPEEIEVVPWQISRLKELLECDDCTEARSIAALFLVRERFAHAS
ncbi:MAG: ADP compounds hydrolase NudE [Pseudomonadota bacterium]